MHTAVLARQKRGKVKVEKTTEGHAKKADSLGRRRQGVATAHDMNIQVCLVLVY